MKRYAWGLIALLALASAVHGAERRTALVIGNSGYTQAPLINPGNDARAVAQALRESGFTVRELRNLNQAAMRRAIREFGDDIAKGGVGLFYYAGHGMQVKGRNYLVPVGSDIQREDEIADQSVDIGLVLEKIATAKNPLNIVILDACRNNPFGGGGGGGGLAPMDAPPGTLIAFATAPGQVAADGVGDNSTYTKHFLTFMREPGLKVEDVFKRTRSAVREESGGRQVPWENTSLEHDFYFKAPDRKTVVADQEERARAQQAAIDRAVEDALRRREKDGAGRAAIEREIAERVAKERAAAERAAADRIAVMERDMQAIIERAQRSQQPAAQPSATVAATAGAPQPARDSKAREPVQVATAATGASRSLSGPSSPPRVGDSWLYLYTERDYNSSKQTKFRRTVDSVTDSEFRIRTGGGDLMVYNKDGNLLRREHKSGEIRTWEPFQPRFRFPLEVGASWEQKFTYKRQDRTIENDATITVIGWESVTVQAGTFNALKIAYASWYRRLENNARGRTAVTLWFVPEIKRWAKLEVLERGNNGVIYADTTEELLSYSLR